MCYDHFGFYNRPSASFILNMSGTKKPDNWRNGYTEIEFKAKDNSVDDVCFLVGKEGSKKIFWAEKHELTSGCPAFETMLLEKYTEEIVPIAIPDDDPDAFDMLIRFLRIEDLHFSSVTVACKTFSLGEKYRLSNLQAAAMNYINTVPMDEQILCNIVENDLFFNAAVKGQCLVYICENTGELVKSDFFLKMPEYIVDIILQVEDISVGEFARLMAVTRWCYNRYGGEIDFKETLLKFLGQIRYSDMTIREFYEFISHFPSAMDPENTDAIVKYIRKSTNNLPSWCTNKCQRVSHRNFNVKNKCDKRL